MRAMQCLHANLLKNSDDTSRHVTGEIFASEAMIAKMDHKAFIDERESNGKLIGFDDSQVWT